MTLHETRRLGRGRNPRSTSEPSTQRTIAGLQPVRECVRVRARDILELFLLEGDNPTLAALERFARDQGVPQVQRVGRGRLDQLARGAQHQGAVAIAPLLPLRSWSELQVDSTFVGVALDRIQDPQNFGAVIRSAVGTCGAHVVWAEHGAAPLSTATFRASAGAVEHASLCKVSSLATTLFEAQQSGIQVIGLAANTDLLLTTLDLARPTLVVVGSEGSGLQPRVRKACGALASVLPKGPVDSLNASAAAAIALYEIARQRGLGQT